MTKEEFHDRLANPERYEILDWIKLANEVLPTSDIFKGVEFKHWELEPGVHTLKLIVPKRSVSYSLITSIRTKFSHLKHETIPEELVKTEDTIYFTYVIKESNHIPL